MNKNTKYSQNCLIYIHISVNCYLTYFNNVVSIHFLFTAVVLKVPLMKLCLLCF